jgi:UDP-2-acetamido-2-deoxy-ribo-hexuluronate aminotransferase
MKEYMKQHWSFTMKNILLDLNILLDYYEKERREKYPESVKVFDLLKYSNNAFISSSSIDNFEFLKYGDLSVSNPYLTRKQKLKIVHNFIKEFLSYFKIAKTPSYLELDYEDIEDSQVIASAKAVNALVLTRDKIMLEKYPNITITPQKLLETKNQKPETKIDFANLKKQYFMYQAELEQEIDKVLNSASYIMGDAIEELEENLCKFTDAKEAITCSSGTDALLLAMMALDIKPGDEVITTPFTFIATAETIALLGAKPVFVDIDEKTYNIDVTKIEEKITPKTKAIIAVSLYGQPCDLDKLNSIINQQPKTKNQKLHLIIDGAQSFGATYKNKAEVHYCDIYTTSFFPAKPLGCFGDGGAVLTNNSELAKKIKMLRVHGQSKRYHHKYIGLGARMDTIQAAIVNVKLKHYKKDLALRQKVARKYNIVFSQEFLVSINDQKPKTKNQKPILPSIKPDRTSAYAQYSIRVKNRDKIQQYLSNNQKPKTKNQKPKKPKTKNQKPKTNIPTAIHYPMPLHLQECFSYLGYKEGDFPVAEKVSKEIMSLPMNPYLSDEEIEYIINNFRSVNNE